MCRLCSAWPDFRIKFLCRSRTPGESKFTVVLNGSHRMSISRCRIGHYLMSRSRHCSVHASEFHGLWARPGLADTEMSAFYGHPLTSVQIATTEMRTDPQSADDLSIKKHHPAPRVCPKNKADSRRPRGHVPPHKARHTYLHKKQAMYIIWPTCLRRT
jgi:hypothetical protein